jgi:hypothetical protein
MLDRAKKVYASDAEEKLIAFDDDGGRWLELPLGGINGAMESYLATPGSFAVYTVWNGAEMEMRAVYSVEQKRLLLDNIYGAITEMLLPDGGMFVYTAPDNCVVLYPDGRTVPVPNAPVVERYYFGG